MATDTFTEVSKIRLAESINGVPNISGFENAEAQAVRQPGPFYLPESGIDFRRVRSGFANALHMHQPLIPAGRPDLSATAVISNLQYKVSALFAEKTQGVAASERRFRNALYHLLMTQTSDFRYWGSGVWTDYGLELCRRAAEILHRDF